MLKSPATYAAAGARLPSGVLMCGPPGTGKTLLARVMAAQAGVPFFYCSGSDFVELFVGRGAARMRALFKEAAAVSPCIVFVDELDARSGRRALVLQLAPERHGLRRTLLRCLHTPLSSHALRCIHCPPLRCLHAVLRRRCTIPSSRPHVGVLST